MRCTSLSAPVDNVRVDNERVDGDGAERVGANACLLMEVAGNFAAFIGYQWKLDERIREFETGG